jgi:hypothetical protein
LRPYLHAAKKQSGSKRVKEKLTQIFFHYVFSHSQTLYVAINQSGPYKASLSADQPMNRRPQRVDF